MGTARISSVGESFSVAVSALCVVAALVLFPYSSAVGSDDSVIVASGDETVSVTEESHARRAPGLDQPATPASVVEIPQATPHSYEADAEAQPQVVPNDDITRYQAQDFAYSQALQSPGDFMADVIDSSPIGIDVRQDRRKLRSGGFMRGLLILNVRRDSAAAEAGLRPFNDTAHTIATSAAVLAAVAFPPAMLALPVVANFDFGASYDMVIGVDGTRVTNIIEFENQMRFVRGGEIVYLNVLRDGARIQVPVTVSGDSRTTTW